MNTANNNNNDSNDNNDSNNNNNNNNDASSCANCGKGEESSGELKACTSCKMVKYCNDSCQEAHRSQHKKECRRRAAELHDEELFKQPPQPKDCPICFLRMPWLGTGNRYQSCCGKRICSGCVHAGAMVGDDHLCPFCRAPAPTSSEEDKAIERVKKRVEMGDAAAIHNLARCYAEGTYGVQQDRGKALELWCQSAELGNTGSYYNIGNAYLNGRGVGRDMKKAAHYWELAAIGGSINARHNLGNVEFRAGNIDRALKHYMIAVRSGSNESLKIIKQLFTHGAVTKDDYMNGLKNYQAYLVEVKSDDRDKAAAYDDEYKYYG